MKLNHTSSYKTNSPSFGVKIEPSRFLNEAMGCKKAGMALVAIGAIKNDKWIFGIEKDGAVSKACLRIGSGQSSNIVLATTEKTPINSLIAIAWKNLYTLIEDAQSLMEQLKK